MTTRAGEPARAEAVKSGCLKLGEPDLGHGLEGELPLLGASLLEPRQPLLHVLDAEAKAGLQRFIH